MFDPSKCDLCGECLARCEYVDYGRDEAVDQFRRLIDGETPRIVSECITCLACNEFCEKGANPFDLILERQEKSGVPPIPEQNTQVFRNMPLSPTQVREGDPEKPALSLCSVGDFIPGLFDGPLFEGLTVLKGGDYFCGIGWVHLCRETPVRENAPRVIENLAATGKEEIVFYHDDCYALVTTVAKDYGIEVPFHPVHIIEFLLEKVRGSIDELRPVGLKAAYQQPCSSRYTPWKDEQLDELFKLIGVERVERGHDRSTALCCGSPLMIRDRERAASVKERNINDAQEHGAQAMAYLCPLCVLNLRKVAAGAGLENYHLIELVKRAMYSPAD